MAISEIGTHISYIPWHWCRSASACWQNVLPHLETHYHTRRFDPTQRIAGWSPQRQGDAWLHLTCHPLGQDHRALELFEERCCWNMLGFGNQRLSKAHHHLGRLAIGDSTMQQANGHTHFMVGQRTIHGLWCLFARLRHGWSWRAQISEKTVPPFSDVRQDWGHCESQLQKEKHSANKLFWQTWH